MAAIVLVYFYSIHIINTTWLISDNSFRSGVAFTKGILCCGMIYFLKSTLVDFAV